MSNVSAPIRIIQTDFRSGEVDPRLVMRVDSKMYPSGAKTLKNCLLRAGGAVSRRPGLTRLNNLSSKRRFISFEYDADEKYILAFGAGVLTIFDGLGAQVANFTSMAWTTDTIVTDMTMTQAGDTMIICHSSFVPKKLRRTSLTTFAISDFAFDKSPNSAKIYQPYLKFEDTTVTLSPSSTSAGVSQTVTASAAIFSAAWVGDTIRINGKELTVTAYSSTTAIVCTAKKTLEKKLDPNPFLGTDGSNTIEVTDPFHGMVSGATITISGAADGAGITKGNINGAQPITVVDEDHYTFDANNSDNASDSLDFGGSAVKIRSTSATRYWDEQVFSSRRGWPAACCFHEDRLWFGGSTSLPDGLFASRTGFYYDFNVDEGQDDASIQVTVGSPRIAKIRHILAGRVLQIFTEGAEFVAKQSDGVALTPATTSIRPQTPYGCSSIRPRSFDGATLFIQANGRTVREFTYDNNQDGFTGTDLTTLSQHLIGPVMSFDVLYGSDTRTEQYAFFVNTNGTMAVFHSNRAEGLAGWVPWSTATGDTFESVCVLGSKVFVAVLRSGARYLERIEMDDDTVTLDWAITQTNATAKVSWALGSTYASKTLHVCSGDYYLGTVTANASGTITTPYAVTKITAGLIYTWQVIPLSPDTQMPDGPMTGEKRRISSVNLHAYETLSLRVDGKAVITTQIGADLSVPPARISKKLKRFLFGFDRDPVVVLDQAAPLPVTILGMTMEISI